MKVGLVAIHYPRPEYWDEFIFRVHQAAEVLAATPGCLEVDCWQSEDNQAVVSTGQWESEQAFMAGFAASPRLERTSPASLCRNFPLNLGIYTQTHQTGEYPKNAWIILKMIMLFSKGCEQRSGFVIASSRRGEG